MSTFEVMSTRFTFLNCFLFFVVSLFCCSKSPGSLLVHFRSRCHTIDCHKHHLSRFDGLKQEVNVVEDILKDLLFGDSKVNIIVIWM